MYTLHSPLFTLHSPLYTLHSPLYTLHSPLLPSPYSLLPTTRYPPPTTYYPQPATHYPLPTTHHQAYGGGRKVGVGGFQESEEEKQRKKKELEDKLSAYRRSVGKDRELEDAHVDEIVEAQKEAEQLMRFGDTRAAIAKLESVR